MPIILSRRGGPATKLERTLIQDESYLQGYIAENPDLLPLDQLKQGLRLLVLVREFPTPSGPIDVLGTDSDANLYLVETKLYKNPDKRLVLAQVLDYGASLWKAYSDPDDFVTRLDLLMLKQAGKGLVQRLNEAYGLDEADAAEFLDNLRVAVASGRFRFVVLMDRVGDRLKDLISYVNANSSFDVLGVALDFYRHEEFDILIPTLHGAERKIQPPGTGGGRPLWDAESFFTDASARLPAEHLLALRSLHEWAQENADEIGYGTGRKTGSFSPKFSVISHRSVFTAGSDGSLTLNFKWLTDPETAKPWRERFGQELIKEGFPLPLHFEDRFVVLPAPKWVQHLDAFLRVLSHQIQQAPPS